MVNGMTKNTYQYGNAQAEVEDASGLSGVLCKDIDGDYFFRVYHPDHSYTDYELNHDDLPITIDQNAMASLYRTKEHYVLDHSPEVLGLSKV